MRLTQRELLDVITNCKSLKSDELARLFIMKKGEYFIQYLLAMEIEKLCEIKRKGMDTNLQYLTADYNSKIRKHDVTVLEGVKMTPKGNRARKFHFYPSTVIETKFYKAEFVITKEHDLDVTQTVVQDNVWFGSFTKSKKLVKKEKGVFYDLVKLQETQNKYNIGTSIHHIMVPSNPYELIDEMYVDVIDGLHDFNRCLRDHSREYIKVRDHAIKVYERQLKLVEKCFDSRSFSLGKEVVHVGKAFGVDIELIFLIISEENNIGVIENKERENNLRLFEAQKVLL